jgi:hypothetical protein
VDDDWLVKILEMVGSKLFFAEDLLVLGIVLLMYVSCSKDIAVVR